MARKRIQFAHGGGNDPKSNDLGWRLLREGNDAVLTAWGGGAVF